MKWAYQLFSAIIVISLGTCFAELPAQLQNSIDKSTKDLESTFETSKESLLERFEKRIDQVRSAPKQNAEERQKLIGIIEAQQALFFKHDFVPFSPTMRDDAVAFLNAVRKADVTLAKAYDKAIEFQTKKSADDAARALLADKRSALAPKIVGVWELNFVGNTQTKWRKTLHSDGTTQDEGGSWTLDRKHLCIRTPSKEAPGGGWLLTAIVTPDGMHLDSTNQIGVKVEGKLLVE